MRRAKTEKGVGAMRRLILASVAILCAVWLGASGCATRNSVQEQIDKALDQRVGAVEEQVEAHQQEIANLRQDDIPSLRQKQAEALTLSSNAMEMSEEALNRAEKAGNVAEGKLLYQVIYTDEAVHFGFDESGLSQQAKEALDRFCESIKAANKDIYIEIQGHTDSIGTREYNLSLGKARAEKVRRYFYTEHGIPLHRVSTFSYGELRPVAENDTSSNRAKNRRVTLVVIQ